MELDCGGNFFSYDFAAFRRYGGAYLRSYLALRVEQSGQSVSELFSGDFSI